MEDNTKRSRRIFLDRGLKIGVAGILGGIGLSKLSAKLTENKKVPSGETMELMTTDGTIIEVDTSEVMEVAHNHHNMDYNVREGMPNRKFVMVVDLAKCKNALKMPIFM